MKTFLRIIGAIFYGVITFCIGIVLAAIIYPTTDPPDWYAYILLIVPPIVFVFSLVKALRPSPTKDHPAEKAQPPSAPDSNGESDTDQVPTIEHEPDSEQSTYYFRGVTYHDDSFLDILMDEEAWRREQRNARSRGYDTFADSSDIQGGLNISVDPDDPVLDEDISPDDDFVDEDIFPHVEYPDFSGSFLHIAGLPLLIGTVCKVSHFPDHLEIASPSHRHFLATEKIADVAILSYKELIKLHESLTESGATSAAFKTLCDAIDISSKKKRLPTHTKFLLMTYRDSASEPQSIIFQLNDGNLQDAIKFASGATANIRPRIDL